MLFLAAATYVHMIDQWLSALHKPAPSPPCRDWAKARLPCLEVMIGDSIQVLPLIWVDNLCYLIKVTVQINIGEVVVNLVLIDIEVLKRNDGL